MITPFKGIQLRYEHYLPFTPIWTVKQHLGKNILTVLDIGCGTGDLMKTFGERYSYKVGLDGFQKYLDICKGKKVYNKVILHDANNTPLPFPDKSFDMVMAIRFIEHLEKPKVYELLSEFERIARKRVLLCIPVGVFQQDPYDENTMQIHRSFWYPNEFKKRGYKVVGNGIINLHTEGQLIQRIEQMSKLNFFFSYWIYLISFWIWIMSGPFTKHNPHLAANMICTKEL